MIGRRTFLAGGLASGFASRLTAQGIPRLPRLAIVALGRFDGRPAPIMANLTAALGELGYVDGRTAAIAHWSASGMIGALPVLAAQVAESAPDVIVAGGASVLDALRPRIGKIPVVVAGTNIDPVVAGYIGSFARPGGTITGLTTGNDEALAKQVQILREFLPGMRRLAVFWTRGNAVTQSNAVKAIAAAQDFGVAAHMVPIDKDDATEEVRRLGSDGATALFAISDPAMDDLRETIAAAAIVSRLATASQLPSYVDAGFLVAYSVDLAALHRRAAVLVHRILQGAAPAETPFETPTSFRLRVNARTARAIGVSVPEAVLALADEVIE